LSTVKETLFIAVTGKFLPQLTVKRA
jgi:hypothetical protein